LGNLPQVLGLTYFLCFFGVLFIVLLLALVCVGGMLVVFLFFTVLSAERYPELRGEEAFLS
jgi:uncharacterized protein (DUF58 family)